MADTRYTPEEIARAGQTLYSQKIKSQVEAANQGKFLVINVNTGDYEVDSDDRSAFRRAELKDPQGLFYLLRIGHASAHRLGSRGKVSAP